MLYIAGDHAGFKLRESVYKLLVNNEYNVMNLNNLYIRSDDYPNIVADVAKKINKDDFLLLFCGSGVGVCIAANRFSNIRSLHIQSCSVNIVERAREHNCINTLCFGQDNLKLSDLEILKIIEVFVKTPCSDETRHIRRINILDRL